MTDSVAAPVRPPNRLNLAWDADPRRTMIISLIGAAVGLALAGYSLFTAKGTSSHVVPPEDVALVNQRPILATDFEAQLQSEFGVSVDQASPEQRHKVLDEMLREELFVQRALELDEAGSDPDTRAAMVAAVEQQVVADATSQIPTDAVLQDYYLKNRDRYSSIGRMTLRDLIPAAGDAAGRLAQAQGAAAALKQGQPVETVMARFGLRDSGRLDGEELYFAAEIHLGPALFKAARTLASGQSAGPLTGPDGPHVLVMVQNVAPVPNSFEQARVEVYSNYKADLEARLQAGEYGYLRDKADILIAKAYQ